MRTRDPLRPLSVSLSSFLSSLGCVCRSHRSMSDVEGDTNVSSRGRIPRRSVGSSSRAGSRGKRASSAGVGSVRGHDQSPDAEGVLGGHEEKVDDADPGRGSGGGGGGGAAALAAAGGSVGGAAAPGTLSQPLSNSGIPTPPAPAAPSLQLGQLTSGGPGGQTHGIAAVKPPVLEDPRLQREAQQGASDGLAAIIMQFQALPLRWVEAQRLRLTQRRLRGPRVPCLCGVPWRQPSARDRARTWLSRLRSGRQR